MLLKQVLARKYFPYDRIYLMENNGGGEGTKSLGGW